MPVIQEVLNALEAVEQTVRQIQSISEAVSSGKDYLKSKHPQVGDDLAVLCEEIRKSSDALASASSIITHFKFVIGDAATTEAVRFNEHLIKHKKLAGKVEQRIDAMRGHCSVIARHIEKIKNKAEPRGVMSLAAVLGLHSPEREKELAEALEHIHNEELQYHQGVCAMAEAVQKALQAVEDELGPPGMMDPENMPKAAVVLGEYAVVFGNLESICGKNADALQTSIDDLQNSAG